MGGPLEELVEQCIEIIGEKEKGYYVSNISRAMDKAHTVMAREERGEATLYYVLENFPRLAELYTDRYFRGKALSIHAKSGMPVFSQMSMFSKAALDTDKQLSFLPKTDDILDDAQKRLYNGQYPEGEIAKLTERKYYERFEGMRHLNVFDVNVYVAPPLIHVVRSDKFYAHSSETKNLGKLFTISLHGFDATKNVFADYKIELYQKEKGGIIGKFRTKNIDPEDNKLSRPFEARINHYFSLSPQDIYNDLKVFSDDFSPMSIEQTLYGPFLFDKNADSYKSFEGVLKGGKGAFVFCVSQMYFEKMTPIERDGRYTGEFTFSETPKERQTRYFFCNEEIKKKVDAIVAKEKQVLNSMDGPEVKYLVYGTAEGNWKWPDPSDGRTIDIVPHLDALGGY